MGRFFMGALVVCACGKVAELPQDAPPMQLLDAFACAAPMQQCGATCVDPTSDPMNCGACGATCGSGVTCEAGHCVDETSSCAEIIAQNPAAATGLFVDEATGRQFYCDMTTTPPTEYGGLAFGEYDFSYVGYSIIPLADYQAPSSQAAFIALYNAQGGAALISPFTSTNCCLKYDGSTSVLYLGTGVVYPAVSTGPTCNGTYSAPTYLLGLNSGSLIEAPPLGSNFFSAEPATSATNCGSGANPALFWKGKRQ